MFMSFDLEFWSDGDGFHPFARHGQAKRCRQGLQSTIGSRAAGGDRAVGALFSLRQRKVERERIPHRAGGAIEAATQAARQLAHDPQAARPSFILPRPEPLSVTRQLTHEPARIRLILISPSRPSKQAWRTAFVTSS
jgi:hypothetical protein